MLFCVLNFKKIIEFKFFLTFCIGSKTNKDKSAEIFPPLLLKPPYLCTIEHVQCWEQKEVSKGNQFLKGRQGFAPLEVITLCMYCTLRKFVLLPGPFIPSCLEWVGAWLWVGRSCWVWGGRPVAISPVDRRPGRPSTPTRDITKIERKTPMWETLWLAIWIG